MSHDLADAYARIARAADLLDRAVFAEAEALAEHAIAELTTGFDEDWLRQEGRAPASLARTPDRARALARALWLGTAVDEAGGRNDRARLRCARAMELYARLRLDVEELDVRAARELGAASHRLGARAAR
ncbi:MAG: hypothetical protein KC731_04065 [Myxococcales bacterium]|nr:hypothetical protein [Myxococcales bacterium]